MLISLRSLEHPFACDKDEDEFDDGLLYVIAPNARSCSGWVDVIEMGRKA
jgi:hypothetical protein